MIRMPSRTFPKVLSPAFAGRVYLSPAVAAAVVAVLSVLGLTTILSSVRALWWLWTTDPLKSIGMVIPVVSFLLILRVWRSLDWEVDGSWWGLALLLARRRCWYGCASSR
jgi:hypothetical protein